MRLRLALLRPVGQQSCTRREIRMRVIDDEVARRCLKVARYPLVRSLLEIRHQLF